MVRPTNIGTAFYAPGEPPAKLEDMPRYLRDEYQKIASAITALAAGHIDITHVAPTKPRVGDIRLADGTHWNPGSGAGFYGYHSATWNKLG